MKDKKTIMLFTGLIIAVVVLLVWVRNMNVTNDSAEQIGLAWAGTNVACLPFGHQNLAQHFHPKLGITVDGENEIVPRNTGIDDACMSEVHTHDSSGSIHIESVSPSRTFTLLDYFAVRGESIEREGYRYQVFVNGEPIDPADYELKDLDAVEVQYVSIQ